MTRALVLVLLALAPAARSQERGEASEKVYPIKLGGRGIWGPSNYRGRSGFAQVGDAWKARFTYNDFTVDGSTDATRTYAARLSYQGEALSLSAYASLTPRANNYSARSVGADAGWAFLPEEEGAWLEEWELSAWWTRTDHTRGLPPHPVRGGTPDRQTLQDDIGGAISATACYLTATFDGYASVYDKPIARAAQVGRNRPPLANFVSLLDSFPENAMSARLEYDRWRAAIPSLSWARTNYVTDAPPAFTYGAGLTFAVWELRFDFSYELVKQKGSPASGYYSAGGSVRF